MPRESYNFPPSVTNRLSVMIMEYEGITNEERAHSYYLNLRDKISILGYNEIPRSDDPSYITFTQKLMRDPNKQYTNFQIVTFDAFRTWSHWHISKESLLDHLEEQTHSDMMVDMYLPHLPTGHINLSSQIVDFGHNIRANVIDTENGYRLNFENGAVIEMNHDQSLEIHDVGINNIYNVTVI